MVFALDGSRPVTIAEFSRLKEAVLDMLDRYTISEKDTHVGLVEFSSSVTVASRLNNDNSMSRIRDILASLRPSLGSARVTDDALRVASNKVFDISAGGRPGASRVLIILTHGKSTGDTTPAEAVKPLKDAGVNVFVVNIGSKADPKEAEDIATSGEHVVPVDDPNNTPEVIRRVVDKLRKDLNKGKIYVDSVQMYMFLNYGEPA
jgi:collagen type VI alpha